MTEESALLNYRNFALIVWDVQYGITSRTINLQDSLKNVKALIDVTHSRGMPVIYSQSTGLPYEYQSAYTKFWQLKRGMDPKTPRMLEGTHDWQIMSEVAPTKEDIVLKKSTHSFFVGTLLENLLRNRKIDVVIISGYSTEVGIEATARHAGQLGFIPVIPEDAIGSSDKAMHDASLMVMRKLFEVRPTSEIIQRIRSDA